MLRRTAVDKKRRNSNNCGFARPAAFRFTIHRSNTLANSAQARKRARQSEQRREHNKGQRSMVRTYIKRVQLAVSKGDKAQAQEALKEATPILDKMARKGIIHRNKAARHKHRLAKQIAALGE